MTHPTPTTGPPAVHHHFLLDLGGASVFAVVGARAAEHGLDIATVAAWLAGAGMFLNGLANAIRMGLDAYRAARRPTPPAPPTPPAA